MKYYIQHTSNGRIIFGSWEDSSPNAEPGLTIKEFEARPEGNLSDWYIDGSKIIKIPSNNNPEYVFDYDQKKWIDPRTEEEKRQDAINDALSKRAKFLSDSDWTQLPDVPLLNKQEWSSYRQSLRDITIQPGYPFDIVWPQAPN